MPGIKNNLYPPIIPSWMPAFIRDQECRIYFSLSAYNNKLDIKNVQVVVINQNTNLSVLDSNKYLAEIKITDLLYDGTIQGDNQYYIIIQPSDLQSGIFELNQFYKVQLRFTENGASDLNDNTKIAAWLVNNQMFFSEWSTVCLIKGIEKPSIYLKGFENVNADDDVVFTNEKVNFIGNMYFAKNANIEKEHMKSYNIKILNKTTDEVISDSGEIYTNSYNPNEINYTLKRKLDDGVGYRVNTKYTTINEYTGENSYTFSIIQNTADVLNATIKAETDEVLGCIKIHIESTTTEVFLGNLTIRRASSRDNFAKWEDIHETSIKKGTLLDYIWRDYTIESGVWYRYCVQTRNSKGDRGTAILIEKPIMLVFDDMFLTREELQLRVKYNPTISSFRKNILESKNDTLGSQYPTIRRNANVKYKQFPISGLITAYCDEEGKFLNKEKIYGNAATRYAQYNDDNNIKEYQDFIYEREFRDKVIDFLYANNVKLFRSTTEGNILVKLMDISFEPNQTLGRMLYTFNATAYEIDECSLENFDKYGIQTVGEYSKSLAYTFSKIGQLQGIYGKENILNILQDIYEKRTVKKYVNEVKCLKWVRIEFNSAPYLIRGSSLTGALEPLPASEKSTENDALGYIVYINSSPIMVSPRGIYELIDDDTVVESISFPLATDVTIDYIVDIEQRENPNLLYNQIFFETKVGQIINHFQPNENVFLRIYQKYLLNYVKYHKQLLSLNKVVIEAEPGTVAFIKDSFDDDFFKHEVGPTGVLEFHDDDAIVTGLRFAGIQLYEISDEEYKKFYKDDAIKKGYFKQITADVFNQSSDIVEPKENGVYNINGQRHIYYNSQWFKFTDDNIVECPIYAQIDYIYEAMKGVY